MFNQSIFKVHQTQSEKCKYAWMENFDLLLWKNFLNKLAAGEYKVVTTDILKAELGSEDAFVGLCCEDYRHPRKYSKLVLEVKNVVFKGVSFENMHLSEWNFDDCSFESCNFSAVRIDTCNFNNCIFFGWQLFQNSRISFRVNFTKCSFMAPINQMFLNCSFSDVSFDNCTYSYEVFQDCHFDYDVSFKGSTVYFNNDDKSSKFSNFSCSAWKYKFYKGIANAYLSGEHFLLSKKYQFLEEQSNTQLYPLGLHKLFRLLSEGITGYGLKPWRYFAFTLPLIILFALLYNLVWEIDFIDSVPLSAGAFFTFGNLFSSIDFHDHFLMGWLYAFECFIGVILNGLFIVALAKYFNYRPN